MFFAQTTCLENASAAFSVLRHVASLDTTIVMTTAIASKLKALTELEIQNADIILELLTELRKGGNKTTMTAVLEQFKSKANEATKSDRDLRIELYTLTGQKHKLEMLLNDDDSSSGSDSDSDTEMELKSNHETYTNIDQIRLQCAWARELSRAVLKCIQNADEKIPEDVVANFRKWYFKYKKYKSEIQDLAYASLNPLPTVEAILNWAFSAQGDGN